MAAVVPTITPPLQGVLELECGLLRLDPQRRLAGGLQQERQRRRARSRKLEGEDLQQSVAAVDGAVRLVEEARPVQQVSELNHDGTAYYVKLDAVTHIYRTESGSSLMLAARNNRGYAASINVRKTPAEILSSVDLS